MRAICTWLLVAAVGFRLPVPARAEGWGYLDVAAKVMSDYRFHGFSESNRRPTLQGIHWVAPGNWYLGTFASGVVFRDGSTSYEIDLYGGHHFYFENNDLNLEALVFTFPDKAGPSST